MLSENKNSIHYWIYSPGDNGKMWDEFYDEGIMGISFENLGDLRKFNSKEEIKEELKKIYPSKSSYGNIALALWQFSNEIKPGDVIFVKKGLNTIIGKGIVSSEYEYHSDRLDKYKNIRHIDWIFKGTWLNPGRANIKALTDITINKEYISELLSLFENKNDEKNNFKKYTREDFLNEVYIKKEEMEELRDLILYKKNIILEGPPGVGKTFISNKLAYLILGEENSNNIMNIQFHQSYSYEDFICGYRPKEEGFELRKGPFLEFCNRAKEDNRNPYFLLIDEINRGDINKIFGELFSIIENEKRGEFIKLLYLDEEFSIPKNLYIIGTMNNSDKSLVFIDYALRRRFGFFRLYPEFKSEGFKKYILNNKNEKLEKVVKILIDLNKEIEEDETLGEDYLIGHSYLLKDRKIDSKLLNIIVKYEIIPLLKEYWIDEKEKFNYFKNKLFEVLND